MRVLHVIQSLDPTLGGPAKVVPEVTAYLANAGVVCDIATSDLGIDRVKGSLSSETLAHTRFFGCSFPDWSVTRKFAFSTPYAKWLNRDVSNYTVVHFHGVFDFLTECGMAICHAQGVPYMVSPWGLLGTWALSQNSLRKSIFLTMFTRQNLRRAGRVQFSTELELSEYYQNVSLPIHPFVLPAGITRTDFSWKRPDQLWPRYFTSDNGNARILFMSRIHPKKGLMELLESLVKLRLRAHVMIAGVGDASYTDACREIVSAAEMQAKIKFVGHLSGEDKLSALHNSDLFLLPSFSESQGIAVLEALASGCLPIVGKNVAMADTLKRLNFGHVHEYSAAALTEAITSAIHDLPTVEQRRSVSDSVLDEYSWESIALKQAQFYRALAVSDKE